MSGYNNTHINVNGVMVSMLQALEGLQWLHLSGYYERGEYLWFRMFMTAYMTMENAPLPSSMTFSCPLTGESISYTNLMWSFSEIFQGMLDERANYEVAIINPEEWEDIEITQQELDSLLDDISDLDM